MSRLAARRIVLKLRALSALHRRKLRVVLSGGRTPVRTYQLLATEYLTDLDWDAVHLYQMDEYVDPGRPKQDFCYFLTEFVVRPLGMRTASLLDRTTVQAGAGGWAQAIRRHERRLVEAGGIDLALHGIGTNGHLGFNEPGSGPHTEGRLVSLSDSTRQSARMAPVPTEAVTLGMRVFLNAKESILLASGREKAAAVAAAVLGPASDDCPASWLCWTGRVTVIVDDTAASGLVR
ncbi:6-phosphogluconolactonase [Micromonospora ureilytica]|uniref:6-phosphogluconolactonase n=1 Tax=Micromonospora ureilytica TaxID=709868 RepID=UPI0033FB367B